MAGPEATIERTICKEAKAAGWLVRKLKFIGLRGAPDRIFGRGGVTIAIEFKRHKGEARVQQLKRIAELRSAFGWQVFVCDTLDGARAILGLPPQ